MFQFETNKCLILEQSVFMLILFFADKRLADRSGKPGEGFVHWLLRRTCNV